MNSIYEEQAKLAAARVDQTQMMMDPATIVAIITQVLPIIASCFGRNQSADPVEAAERFREYYKKDPKGMRKKLARRIRAEADQPMSKEESFALADGIIWQMLSVEDEVIVSGCMEAPADL